jgi:NAD(P)-dependent dehydrogenase (short-subunit alcohol dehydrogenase family)
MDLGLKDRTGIITGGASGLGRETAHYLAREGAAVVIADLNDANVAKVVGELRAAGARAEGITMDVRNYEDNERMVGLALEKFGSADLLVASAGVSAGKFFIETRPEDWDRMLDINIRGVMNANRAVLPAMTGQRRGAIVNIASEAGKLGEKRMTVYAATKGAVIGFSKALSVEMGRYNVRVNAVCPGVTQTPMTAGYTAEQVERFSRMYPLGRLGQPEDIAAMITFLLSDQTSWVTGQAISVSGGWGRA